MPTERERILNAVRKAHAAGDTESADRLAAMAKALPWEPQKRTLEDIKAEGAAAGPHTGVSDDDVLNAWAGAGETFVNSGRTLNKTGRKLGAALGILDDQTEELKRLDEETREARKRDAPLLATKAGQAGQVAGDIAQSIALTAATGGLGGAALGGAKMVPGAVRAGQLAARALPTATRALGSNAAKAIALDATASGLQGALQDTTSDESKAQNVMEGALLGAAIPGIQSGWKPMMRLAEASGAAPVGRGALKVASIAPVVGAGPGRLLQMGQFEKKLAQDEYKLALQVRNKAASEAAAAARPQIAAAQKAATRAEQEANRQAKAQWELNRTLLQDTVKKQAGNTMGQIAPSYQVRNTPELAKDIAHWKAGNKSLLKVKGVSDVVRTLDLLGTANSRMTGETAQMLKAKLGALARDPELKKHAQSLHQMERRITDQIYADLSKVPGGKAKVKALREAFELSAKAHQGKLSVSGMKPVNGLLPGQKPPVATALPQAAMPPMPIDPRTAPFSRDWVGTYGTAAGRGMIMPREEYEE